MNAASRRPIGGCPPRAAWPRRLLVALLPALPLGLHGCAAPQPPAIAARPVIDTPAVWSATTAAATVGTRARLPFDDTTLQQLVREALDHHPGVASAAAALVQARALRDGAAAGLQPALTAAGSAQRSRSGTAAPVSSFRLGLDAAWEADLFGASRAALAAREAEVAVAAAELGDAQVSLAAETALAYLALRSAQQRLAIAADNLRTQQETAQIVGWRAQAGLATVLEVEQARAAALQLRAQQSSLRSSVQRSAHALASLTGRPPSGWQSLVDQAAPLPQPLPDVALAVPADTLRQRPDVRAAESAWEAAARRTDQAGADAKPSLRLGGSIGLNALTLGSLTSSRALVASLLGSMSWPLVDGGAADASIRAQQAATERAAQAWRSTVLEALREVEDALVALRHDRERLAALQGAAQSAALADLVARQRHASGLVDFQTVLETQRSQLSAQDAVALAQADIANGHVRLFKALGGGWVDETAGSPAGILRSAGQP